MRSVLHLNRGKQCTLLTANSLHDITCINHLVLEVSNGDTLLIKLIIGPGDDLTLHNRRAVGVELGEEGQGVGPHQLPDQGQRQGPVTLHDVRAWIIRLKIPMRNTVLETVKLHLILTS